MKATIDGKRYNSETCEKLAEYDHHNNGNYSGTTSLLLAKNGEYLECTDSNGQDGYLRDSLTPCEDVKEFLDGATISNDQEARLVELGMIEII